MRGLLIGLAFVLIALPACAQKSDTELNGEWQGAYSYSDSRAPVNFILEATIVKDRISGTISEPNTFGSSGVAFLHANIAGTIEDGVVRFTKTYDGTGGQSHSIQYEGVLDPLRLQISGTWRISSMVGQFAMTRAR